MVPREEIDFAQDIEYVYSNLDVSPHFLDPEMHDATKREKIPLYGRGEIVREEAIGCPARDSSVLMRWGSVCMFDGLSHPST